MEYTTTPEQEQAYQEYLRYLREGSRMFPIRNLVKMRPGFQRNLTRADVARISREWQDHRFDDPVVCICSDGTELLDDGQHRVAAAFRRFGPDAELRCRVVYSDQPGEEFVKLNSDRRAVSAFWKFNALLSDGNESVKAITELAARHDFTITKGGGSRSIQCVSAVTELYNTDAVTLGRTLSVLSEIIKLRDDEPGWLRAHVIQSVWYMLRTYDCDDKIMARKLARVPPERAVPHTKKDAARNAGDIIIAYNFRLPENKRLDITRPVRTS